MLDIELPGWPPRVDAGRLDLENPRCCLLGQLFSPVPWRWVLRHPKLVFWHGANGFTRGLMSLPLTKYGVSPGVFADRAYQDYWIEEIADRIMNPVWHEPFPFDQIGVEK